MGEYLRGVDFVTCRNSAGGTLQAFGPEADEAGKVEMVYMYDVFVPPGKHRVSRFMVGLGRNYELRPGDNVVCYPPDVISVVQDFGVGHSETGASQTFKVDRAERDRKERERLERRLDAFERRQALQQAALERAASEPRRVADSDPDEEPDDGEEPEPEPAPAKAKAKDR